MLRASYPKLNAIHFMGLIFSSVMFLFGFVLRLLVVLLILFLGNLFFEQSFDLTINTILPTYDSSVSEKNLNDELWIYMVLGYIILIKSILFLFGRNFSEWVRDTVLYGLFMISGMFPVKWIARGLLSNNYFAQLIAGNQFMGTFIAQTISAAPTEIINKYDRIYDLYNNSNDEDKRRELIELCTDE